MPTRTEPQKARVVRLVLGDQLVHDHPWWHRVDPDVLHVLMEVRQETDYAWHHIQKVLGFFGAMRRFAEHLRAQGHRVHYLTLDDPANQQDIGLNLQAVITQCGATELGYLLPDEHRLDEQLKHFAATCGVPVQVADTHHFLTERQELAALFKGKKQYL
ncbi:MAG TPA: cryptochrome/photolyase family protein, partial [Flavobacteriales bacterium]|nr:cryptochrome/photolyase family protein [Flavobacteriales bacterium]